MSDKGPKPLNVEHSNFVKNFTVRLDYATAKKVDKLRKTLKSNNAVFIEAVNTLFSQVTSK
jgi:hypothetical protein